MWGEMDYAASLGWSGAAGINVWLLATGDQCHLGAMEYGLKRLLVPSDDGEPGVARGRVSSVVWRYREPDAMLSLREAGTGAWSGGMFVHPGCYAWIIDEADEYHEVAFAAVRRAIERSPTILPRDIAISP